MEVLQDLGSCIPMVSFQDFLDYFAPPQPNFDLNATIATLQSLKLGSEPGVLTSEDRWSKFSNDSNDSIESENSVFSSMPEIFTKVVVAVVANSGGRLRTENRTVDFLQNPSLAPTYTDRCDESKPDGYMVLKGRNNVISKPGEDILWADIALSCEYRQEDGDEDLSDVCTHEKFRYCMLG